MSEILRSRYVLALAAFLAALFAASFVMPPAARLLARFFAYMSLASNSIPLPATPWVIYMGRDYPWVAVALVGAVGTTLANLLDYEIFSSVFKTKLLSKIKESEHSRASIKAFSRVAFPTLVAVNFILFTWDLVRLVAIAAKYPRVKYAAATFVGRAARYAILAAAGEFFEPPLWAIGVVTVVLALPAFVSWLRAKRRRKAANDGRPNG